MLENVLIDEATEEDVKAKLAAAVIIFHKALLIELKGKLSRIKINLIYEEVLIFDLVCLYDL